MVSRFREERGRGRDLHDAVVQTVATAGKTVVFSGLTVAVAMCGLFVFGLPILTSFGIAGLGVVLLCMAAAVTLLPATLAVVGTPLRPDTPAGLTVVDVTPAGTSQGPAASELVGRLRGTQATFDTEVGGIAAELIDIKARLHERLPLAALMVVAATLV